jgi:hypothetical protein
MISSTTYVIRGATVNDARALERLAALDSQRRLRGRIVVGEIDGRIAAAVSVDDGRVVADPFQHTGNLVTHLRMRARGILAAERMPHTRDRARRSIRITRLERT